MHWHDINPYPRLPPLSVFMLLCMSHALTKLVYAFNHHHILILYVCLHRRYHGNSMVQMNRFLYYFNSKHQFSAEDDCRLITQYYFPMNGFSLVILLKDDKPRNKYTMLTNKENTPEKQFGNFQQPRSTENYCFEEN